MQSYRVQVRPLSAFGTPLLGDTLFGQLCWALRNRHGEDTLNQLLQGYTHGNPFMVVSNAFPRGYIPRPDLPSVWFANVPDTQRKAAKKQVWMPLDKLSEPLANWQQCSKNDRGAGIAVEDHLQPHNSIDRRTGTTNASGFSPYSMIQHWYAKDTLLDIYLLLDDVKADAQKIQRCLEDISSFGYGRDASIGMGKFSVEKFASASLPAQQSANACLSLGSCAPQGLGFDGSRSFYQLFTRFGRHGDLAVHHSGQPFKNPVLLAKAGAVFATQPPASGWIGQGLGGDGLLSKTVSNTVQQGYAPVIPVHLPATREQ